MPLRRISLVILFILICIALAFPQITGARYIPNKKHRKAIAKPSRVMVLDGSNVHNVGELHMHVGNWGQFGSMPGSGISFSNAPSAEWPAGSGVEYLYAAGLWVGAMKNGVPAVSTAIWDIELRPTDDPIDVIYRTSEGANGGNRLPSPYADDDDDGAIDEDRLDGQDNDGDGLIDEDFAAISDQMFSCWYTDDQPAAGTIYPNHNPLHISVRQESYQWEADRFDDFVGVQFEITNIGPDVLEDIYLGIFADPDIGPRNEPEYWNDDCMGYRLSIPVECTDIGPAQIDLAYAFDEDGDEGQTPGYFGVMILNHLTDPTGLLAPKRVGITSLSDFSGQASYEDGGEPTNDFERYEVLSSATIGRGDCGFLDDRRMLIGVGPFAELPPGETLLFQIGFVIGSGFEMIDNAASAKITFDGAWYDIDGDPLTGIDRRETPIPGPAYNVVIDSCREELKTPIDWPYPEPIYINDDCAKEDAYKIACGYSEDDSLLFRTGVAGKETQIYWVLGGGSVPVLIHNFTAEASESGVELIWDISSDEQIRGFNIYRWVERGGSGECVNAEGIIPPEERRYLDASARPGRNYQYALGVLLEDDSELRSQLATVRTEAYRLALHQNYPNPFNPTTMISFTLPERGHVDLSIYSLDGKLIKTLVDETMVEGFKEVPWNGKDARGNLVGSGVYFYRLKAGEQVIAKKMILLK